MNKHDSNVCLHVWNTHIVVKRKKVTNCDINNGFVYLSTTVYTWFANVHRYSFAGSMNWQLKLCIFTSWLTLGLLRVQEPIYQLVNYRYTSVVVAIPYGRTKRRSCWCSIFCEDSLLSALLSIAVFFRLCFLNPLYSEVWHGMSEIGLWSSYAHFFTKSMFIIFWHDSHSNLNTKWHIARPVESTSVQREHQLHWKWMQEATEEKTFQVRLV